MILSNLEICKKKMLDLLILLFMRSTGVLIIEMGVAMAAFKEMVG